MSFFKEVGKIGKAIGNVTGKVLKTVAPIASLVPGVGTLVSGAASTLGEVLSPTKQAAIVNAVQRDGVVKVDEIEKTILTQNPALSEETLTAVATEMTTRAVSAVPTATINDTASVTDVDFITKAYQWVKGHIVLVGAAIIGIILFTGKTGKKRSRRW